MPGMLSPCPQETGDMRAPVPQNNTRFHRPSRTPFSSIEQSTAALQPQPEPPA